MGEALIELLQQREFWVIAVGLVLITFFVGQWRGRSQGEESGAEHGYDVGVQTVYDYALVDLEGTNSPELEEILGNVGRSPDQLRTFRRPVPPPALVRVIVGIERSKPMNNCWDRLMELLDAVPIELGDASPCVNVLRYHDIGGDVQDMPGDTWGAFDGRAFTRVANSRRPPARRNLVMGGLERAREALREFPDERVVLVVFTGPENDGRSDADAATVQKAMFDLARAHGADGGAGEKPDYAKGRFLPVVVPMRTNADESRAFGDELGFGLPLHCQLGDERAAENTGKTLAQLMRKLVRAKAR